jgi:predicted negative regulator of RcsB-dependent stress response
VDPRYSEDEQVEQLKSWWKKNGPSLIIGVVLGLGIVIGWQGWGVYTASRAEEASSLYQLLLGVQSESALEAGDRLIKEFTDTPYAAKAALLLAAAAVKRGDAADGRQHLNWVLENSEESGTLHAARLHLGQLELGEGNIDDALAVLKVGERSAFESHYRELEGDAYSFKGDAASARTAYQESLAVIASDSPYRGFLEAKLADLATIETAQ